MPESYGVRAINDLKTPMRDGVRLSSDLYLPEAPGPFPTIFIRTPYDSNGDAYIQKGRRLAERGYACIIQDCRGRYDSEGEYYPFANEAEDGYDTQEWIGRQPWCDGSIGLVSSSYGGWVQWHSAPLRSRYVKCLAPALMCVDIFSGLVWPGGALQLNVLMNWGLAVNGRTRQSIAYLNWRRAFRTLPLREADRALGRDVSFWDDWLGHETYDAYWERTDVERRWGEIIAPAFIIGGWYDIYASQSCDSFVGMRNHGGSPEARRSRLLMGPWNHANPGPSRAGDVEFGLHAAVDYETWELRWNDYWLRGIDDGISREPPVRLFVMGANVWRDEHEWPLARTDWQRWHLHSRGGANTLLGDGVLDPAVPGEEPPDRYRYHPEYPVPTNGGNNCCSPLIVPQGPYDQRDVEMRHDVLCYTSEPLAEDLEVTGPIRVVLFAESDCPDTDWTAKLVDVHPDGYALNLCDGIVRARTRQGRDRVALLEPGTVYQFEIGAMVTSNVFKRGHRVRLEISSSNFPRFDRNPNTGRPIGSDAEMRAAHQTIHHSPAYPSHVLLPAIPSRA